MAQRSRTPNTGLPVLLDQAGWSRSQFASIINRLGAEAGMSLKYGQPAVSQWVAGHEPRAQVRALLVEAFERKLGRPVTYAEAGLTPPAGPGEADTVRELVDLGRADMDPSRRRVITTAVFSAALAIPLFPELAHADSPDPIRPGKATTRVGQGQVEAVRSMTDRIADILDELGAGHARPMAAAFLVNTVGPWLKAEAAAPVRRSMLAAASDLVYLTGWMAMYERQHRLGQDYYVSALKLAGEAEDHLTYCRTLRGMSLQASNLGYGRRALELADSAAEAAPAAGPRLVAFLRGQQAHSAAMVGDRRTAFTRLREAESALARADDRRESVGGYDRTAYLFHVAHVLNETKDLPGSVRTLKESIRVQPANERQGRLHSYGLLAQRQLAIGHVEAACESWGRFLDEYEGLSSARGDEHFEVMTLRLKPHTKVRAVRELRDRAQMVGALKR
ncbi:MULTISPECIES: hypothetical protein [unclassified Streptomyces]|uniref:hypothetical protein n=1 Tax=unclassified Streptomyces TaxID=2593676 RepID=UPI00224EAC31|nr:MULTISPECIES: hypothetical protein [unclassified Streptomyces]MCX4526432.1 hypothetical protein [Streptomyces sp. NBC_01551]MCX4543005.1 hypothetical protein [Streptomyces sp. NBC_01565]